MKVINLQANPDVYRARTYGIPFVSKTEHTVSGPGVHNPAFPHRLDVWRNRPAPAGSCAKYSDPLNQPTDDEISYLLSARAVVLSNQPQAQTPRGDSLEIGDEVTLTIEGIPLEGTFRVTAGHLSDPQLVRI